MKRASGDRGYADLAMSVGVIRCRGIRPATGLKCFEDHDKGTWADGMVHWGERTAVTMGGIRRFLYLASMSNPVVANSTPGWQQIYVANMWVKAMSRSKGIVLPARLANLDRARVRAGIVNLPVDTPLRAEAYEWSR